jgi:hypothetical protein
MDLALTPEPIAGARGQRSFDDVAAAVGFRDELDRRAALLADGPAPRRTATVGDCFEQYCASTSSPSSPPARARTALWRSRGPPPMPVACVSIRRPPAERTHCGAPLERPAGQSEAVV